MLIPFGTKRAKGNSSMVTHRSEGVIILKKYISITHTQYIATLSPCYLVQTSGSENQPAHEAKLSECQIVDPV